MGLIEIQKRKRKLMNWSGSIEQQSQRERGIMIPKGLNSRYQVHRNKGVCLLMLSIWEPMALLIVLKGEINSIILIVGLRYQLEVG